MRPFCTASCLLVKGRYMVSRASLIDLMDTRALYLFRGLRGPNLMDALCFCGACSPPPFRKMDKTKQRGRRENRLLNSGSAPFSCCDCPARTFFSQALIVRVVKASRLVLILFPNNPPCTVDTSYEEPLY